MTSDESMERIKTSAKPKPASGMSMQQAIDFGEYDPKFLSGFSEWHSLSRHTQFQLIRQAIENRNKQLITQWAEINNVLNFSKKPHLQEALRNIEEQRRKLEKDKEDLYLEYSRI